MSDAFELIIAPDATDHGVEFRLLDGHGSQLAYRHTDFTNIPLSQQQGLFDLQNYVRHCVEPGREAEAIAGIGVCIANDVLGADIFRKLWTPVSQRSLRIRLPAAARQGHHLGAALARVPWEIARPSEDRPTLEERALLVRLVDENDSASEPLRLGPDECLRVLYVFAEARGSRPLAARREQRQFRDLLEREIYPTRRVVADVLSYGVTRERLRAQIQENNGYHIVHWSGHGHLNMLELAKAGGMQDTLTGQGLLDLFVEAGGFIPRLFFLSACHSGDALRIQDWQDFLAAAQGQQRDAPSPLPAPTRDMIVQDEPGYTGTAHALLAGGVPTVVAMRYAIGDEYARELSIEFYRALLAHAQPKTVAAALAMARKTVRDPQNYQQNRYGACDHATPVLYGVEQPGLPLPNGRSPALNSRDPRLPPIAELTAAEHRHFVGRTWELAGLGADFIGARHGTETRPVAVITGLGGMGKTALAAEALALWQLRFKWVLLFQAKSSALQFETALSDMHTRLVGELGRYHDHVQANPADAIHRAPTTQFTGPARLQRLIGNLVRALRDEPILVVLDNFETNLKPHAEPATPAGDPAWACQDPVWDECLARLAVELAGTPSRVLITCRRPLAALAGKPFHAVRLGPLPSGEAALYLREHAGLGRMIFGGDAAERALALRLMNASRFHPLLMDRLAQLATGGQALRPQLLQALDALQNSGDQSGLPALFETGRNDARELAYLDDALAISIDQLIAAAEPGARLLLWIISLAHDPVTRGMVDSIWSDEAAKPGGPADPTTLLRYLLAVGLATEERSQPDDDNPNLTCHELVRERMRAWMQAQPQDRVGLTENAVLLAYAERLEGAFHNLVQSHMAGAQEAGRRAMIYYIEAQAYGRLADFAVGVVVKASDPRLLNGLLPHLQNAALSAADGRDRWRCLLILADALDNSGRTHDGLPFYEQAATLAKAAGKAGNRQAWSDYAVVVGNWAVALQHVGELERSLELQRERTSALKTAGASTISIMSSELAAFRIDIDQGRAAEVLSEIERMVGQIERWWQQSQAGKKVAEAPDPEELEHMYLDALDIDRQARIAVEQWEVALRQTDAILAIRMALKYPIEDIAIYWRNRATILIELGRFGEAQTALQACLQVFTDDPINRARTLHSLADLFREQGDLQQAILQGRRAHALFDTLPSPDDRSASHNNLANYLRSSGQASAIAEAACHRLAALVYAVTADLGWRLENALHNYVFDSQESGQKVDPEPSLERLLADPAFHPLDVWLRQREVDIMEVQAVIREYLTALRNAQPD